MKHQYMVAFIMDNEFITNLDALDSDLKALLPSYKGRVSRYPYLTIKAPFEAEDQDEAKLVTIVSDIRAEIKQMPLMAHTGSAWCSAGDNLFLQLIKYTDIALGLGARYRSRLLEEIHQAFPESADSDVFPSVHLTLGPFTDDEKRKIIFTDASLADRPTKISAIGVLRKNDTGWDIIGQCNF